MQIKENLYNWLLQLSVIPPQGKKYADKVEIPQTIVQTFESGIAFGQLLREIVKLRNRPMTPLTKLDSLKDNQQKASYLYNWKILVEEYQKVGITIDQDTKGLILGGDREMIHQLLAEIYEQHQRTHMTLPLNQSFEESQNMSQVRLLATNKISQANQQVDLSKLDMKKELHRTQNCLEFFIIALAKNLQLTTKQAASLFTNNNKYLAHILAKGVKGIFEPIVAFFKETYANANQLNKLFSEDTTKKSMIFAFQALKPGLISKSFEVAYEAIRLFNKLAQIIQVQLAREWFFEDQGGLYTILMGARRHPDLVIHHVEFIQTFGKNAFVEVFTNGIKQVLPDPKDFMNSIELIYPPMSSNKELVSTGILNDWVTQAINISENEFKNSIDTRISANNFLTEVLLRQELDETLTNQIIALLKKGSRDKSQSLTLLSLNHLFKLLQSFGQNKSNYGPLIYKYLTLSLIENHDNQMIREFILQNFINIFQTLDNIPTSLVIENLIKQLQTSEGVTYIINTFDMQFFMFLSNQNIGIKNAIQMLDLLAKIFLNNIVYQSMCADIIVNILSKNADNQTMQEFILKFVKIALAMHYASEKKKQGKDQILAQKRNQIVEIIKTIVQFQQSALNDKIKPLVAHTNIQIKQTTKKNSKGMMAILELFGNPERIMEFYEVEFREQQARQLVASDDEDNPLGQTHHQPRGPKLTKEEQYSLASLKTTKADPKVLETLETIKKNYEAKITSKVASIENEKEAQTKQKNLLRKQLEKRSIEQGISIIKDREASLIYPDGKKAPPFNKHGLTEYEVYDLTYEEDRVRLLIEQVFRRFHKIFKHIFFKYANSGHKIVKPKDFDNLGEMADTINEAEFWQFLKDFELNFHVQREQVRALMRSVAIQLLKCKTELTNFNFDGFKLLLTQYAMIIFTRNNKFMAPHDCLNLLLQHMRQIAAVRKENTQLYDDPENMFFSQTEVIKEFNRQLQEDPNYPLPEGYKAVREPKVEFRFSIVLDQQNEGAVAAFEVMDYVLNLALGVHLVEPTTEVGTQLVCRPNMLGYVKSKVAERLSGSYIEPTGEEKKRNISQSVKQLPKRTLEIEPFRTLGFGVKMGMAQIPFRDRGIAEQVALCIEDLIYAVENGKLTANRKEKIINRVLKEQQEAKQKELDQKQHKKEKFVKDHEAVIKKGEEIKKEKEILKEKERPEREKRERMEQKKKEQLEKLKKEKEEYLKQQKEKTIQKQKQEEEERIKLEIEEKQKRAKEIQEKQEKFNKFNEVKIQEYKRLQEAEKERLRLIEEEKREKEKEDQKVYEKLYAVIEKKGEAIKQKEKATAEKILELFNSEKYQKVFLASNMQLSYLFELLLLETYQSLEMLGMKELVLKIWMWFGERFRIYPDVIPQIEFIRVFNALTYQKQEQPASLSYQEFLQALLRVGIKGFAFFNKLATHLKEPQPPAQGQPGPKEDPQPPQSMKRSHHSRKFMKEGIKQGMQEQEQRLKQVNTQLSEQKKLEKEALLLDNYKGLGDFTPETLEAVIKYLALPKDKQGVELRFRFLMEEESRKQPNKMKKQEAAKKLDEDYEKWREIKAVEERRNLNRTLKQKKPQQAGQKQEENNENNDNNDNNQGDEGDK